ncbi:MAG: hypothetical protein Q7J69_04765 [Candidatus Omnitrophota bacterium]|nr:hypothetical protein [Candidatus Omnitrophota bacterium]
MTPTPPFSERHGYQPQAKPITIWHEAPPFMRAAILSVAAKSGFHPNGLRSVICAVLDEIPNTGQNWSPSNVLEECEGLIHGCEWFEVYDICEALARERPSYDVEPGVFEKNLNNFFLKKGIGWKMENGLLSVRGEQDYEKVTAEAIGILEQSGRSTALGELREAIRDLARRPEPDLTGAVQHAMAALECLARDMCDSKKTLGDLIRELGLPAPVDVAVEKMWGFASNQGRHVAEGKKPELPETMLTVHFCSAIVSYLLQRKTA